MKKLLGLLFAALLAFPAHAANTSTVDPTIPKASYTPTNGICTSGFTLVNGICNYNLASTPIRNNFAAMANDINALWTAVGNGGGGSTTLSGDCTGTGSSSIVITCNKTNGVGFGTAATRNVSAFLQPANNFSDVGDIPTALSNLGGGAMGKSLFTSTTARSALTSLIAGDGTSTSRAAGPAILGTCGSQVSYATSLGIDFWNNPQISVPNAVFSPGTTGSTVWTGKQAQEIIMQDFLLYCQREAIKIGAQHFAQLHIPSAIRAIFTGGPYEWKTATPIVVPRYVNLDSTAMSWERDGTAVVTPTTNWNGDPTTGFLKQPQYPMIMFATTSGTAPGSNLAISAQSNGSDNGVAWASDVSWEVGGVTIQNPGSGIPGSSATCSIVHGDTQSTATRGSFNVTVTGGAATAVTTTFNRYNASNNGRWFLSPWSIRRQYTTANGWDGDSQAGNADGRHPRVFADETNYYFKTTCGGIDRGLTVSVKFQPSFCKTGVTADNDSVACVTRNDGPVAPDGVTGSNTPYWAYGTGSPNAGFIDNITVAQSGQSYSADFGYTYSNWTGAFEETANYLQTSFGYIGTAIYGSDYYANHINSVGDGIQLYMHCAGCHVGYARLDTPNDQINSDGHGIEFARTQNASVSSFSLIQSGSDATHVAKAMIRSGSSLDSDATHEVTASYIGGGTLSSDLTQSGNSLLGVYCAHTNSSTFGPVNVSNTTSANTARTQQFTKFAEFGTDCRNGNVIMGSIDRITGNIFTGTVPLAGLHVWDGQVSSWVGPGGHYMMYATGPPTNGSTGANKAVPTSLYFDESVGGQIYYNSGTQSSPVWTQLGGGGNLTFTGDVTGSGSGTVSTTNIKTNGVAYPASPAINTVPVVTGTNQVTYKTAPIAAGGTNATTARAAFVNLFVPYARPYKFAALGDSISSFSSFYPSDLDLTNIPAWPASTAVLLNEIYKNGTNVYKVTTAGTTASSGGPTGITSGISDGGAVWAYVMPTASKSTWAYQHWLELFSGGRVVWDLNTGYKGVTNALVKVLVVSGGTGYTNADTVTFGGNSKGTITVDGNGTITAVNVTQPGQISAPLAYTITTTAGTGAVLQGVGVTNGSFAISGMQTVGAVAYLPDVCASDADIVGVHIGTNDLPIKTAAQITANLKIIYDGLNTCGKYVVAIPLLPKTGGAVAWADVEKIRQVNRWIYRYAAREATINTAGGTIFVADATGVMTDQTTNIGPVGGTGGGNTAVTQDGIHPNSRGAQYVGATVWETVQRIPGVMQAPAYRVGAYDIYDGASPSYNAAGNYFEGVKWNASTSWALGDLVANDTAPIKVYRCVQAGVSASSSGPTGTGSNITDNTAKWTYIRAAGMSNFSSGTAGVFTASSGITYSGNLATGYTLSRGAGTATGTITGAIESPWSNGIVGTRQVLTFSLSGGTTDSFTLNAMNTGYANLGIQASDLGSSYFIGEIEMELSGVAHLNSIQANLFDFSNSFSSSNGAQLNGAGNNMMASTGEPVSYPNNGKITVRTVPFRLPAGLVNVGFWVYFYLDTTTTATATIKINHVSVHKVYVN